MINEIYLGKCEDILDSIPDESVDAIVTDPPFGIGFGYEQGKELNDNPEDYWKWLQPKYIQMLAKVKPGGFVSVWQTAKYFPYLFEWFGKDIHIYAACKRWVQLRKTPINYGFDPIVMFYKQGETVLRPEKPPRNIDFYLSSNTKYFLKPEPFVKRHPCPRPLNQAVEIINNFVVPSGVVLDPFGGAGTIAVACKTTGRSCISIEMEEKYVEIIKKRLEFRKSENFKVGKLF